MAGSVERKPSLLLIAVALAALLAGGLLWLRQAPASGTKEPDKPIMYMTPSDLFSNPKLRELAKAAQNGDVKKIDALIAQGVSVNGKGRYGIAPLFSAVQAGSKAGFKALLDHGANPNNVWTDGYTLMNMIACCSSDPYFMTLALQHGANPNLEEPHTGMSPIMAAVTESGKVNIPILIKAGANLNHQIPAGKGSPMYGPGETALMGATGLNFDVVNELLQAGADYRIKDAQGRNLEDDIVFSFQANLPESQDKERDKAIAFLKEHDAWDAPPRVENLRASTKTVSAGGTYTLSWDPVPGADHYDLFRNGSHGSQQNNITKTTVEETEPESEDWQAVWWEVRACTKTKCGGVSEPVFINIIDNGGKPTAGETQGTSAPSSLTVYLVKQLATIHEHEGSDAEVAPPKLGCVPPEKLTNKDTPLDLDFAWMKCLMNDQYDRAVAIFSLSIAYADFDTLRVADKTAHGVNSEVFGMVASGVPQAKLKKFDSVKYKTLNDPARFGAICTRIAEIGPPGYYPEYMVGHGMQMFTGMQTAQGLVPGFDAAKAWTETLKDNLHCSNVAASKIPSGASAPTSRSASTADGSQATDPLAPTNDIGCVAADQLNNNDTPPDLFAAIVKCVKTNDYDQAVFMLMMAGVYADFDMRRVPDPTTHNVDMVLLNRSKKTMSEAEIKTLGKDLAATADTPAKLAAVCEQLERTGPPDYYPRYMVQFGMDAATGLKTPNGLATDFDSKQAWHDALTQYLNCTNVPASAATTPN